MENVGKNVEKIVSRKTEEIYKENAAISEARFIDRRMISLMKKKSE